MADDRRRPAPGASDNACVPARTVADNNGIMRVHIAVFPAVTCLATWLSAQAPSLPPLHAAVDAMAHALSLDAAGLIVEHRGRVVHQGLHGNLQPDTAMPIASASKWLAVATVMALVDDGKLDLDVSVARYLPAFDRPDKRALTLRQCLSCTAGFQPTLPPQRLRRASMAEAAVVAAEQPLRTNPGTAFCYSGVGFQVAACAAEAVSGQDFHSLFAERIAKPLGLTQTAFGTLVPIGAEAGTAKLPWVAGGAVSTLADYMKFCAMLADHGRAGDAQVLSAKSVAAMFADATQQLPVRSAAMGDVALHYGLGTWVLPLEGGVARVCDPGAFGFSGWIDQDLGIAGVFAVRDRVGRVMPRLLELQALVRQVAQTAPVAGTDRRITLLHDGRDRSYILHVPPQAATAKQRLPCVMVLHGGGGNAEQVADDTGFSALADRDGFVVVYPDGTGPLRRRLLTWNSGGLAVYAADHRIDDVGFLRAVVDDVLQQVAIDPERVYATGMSNGAMMCHRLAREAADVFAAIAPVSGAMDFTEKEAQRPLSVLIVHGDADQHVRYDGGRPERAIGRAGDRKDASVADAAQYYRQLDHLSSRSEPRTEQDGKVRIDTWAMGDDGKPSPVRLQVVTLVGGGHAWPGGKGGEWHGGDKPFAWPASEAIWQFVREARLQPQQ